MILSCLRAVPIEMPLPATCRFTSAARCTRFTGPPFGAALLFATKPRRQGRSYSVSSKPIRRTRFLSVLGSHQAEGMSVDSSSPAPATIESPVTSGAFPLGSNGLGVVLPTSCPQESAQIGVCPSCFVRTRTLEVISETGWRYEVGLIVGGGGGGAPLG